MNCESKILKLKDFKLNTAKVKSNTKNKLSINVWYNQFGLVYLKSVAL